MDFEDVKNNIRYIDDPKDPDLSEEEALALLEENIENQLKKVLAEIDTLELLVNAQSDRSQRHADQGHIRRASMNLCRLGTDRESDLDMPPLRPRFINGG